MQIFKGVSGKNRYTVIFTTNGEQALDMIQEENPDLMTLDIRMPGIDGYEVLKKTKQINEGIKIIVLSAIDIPGMEQSLKNLGAQEVLRKPVDLNTLLKTIQNITSDE